MTRVRSALALGGAGAVALMAAIVGSACGTQDINVAILPAPEAGHAACIPPSPDGGSTPATGDAGLPPCPTGEFCQPTACGDVSTGTCEVQPAPSSCTGPYSPVCGCDGVTYFNDCLRQSVGVPASQVSGACGPFFCGGSTKCAANPAGISVCALVLSAEFAELATLETELELGTQFEDAGPNSPQIPNLVCTLAAATQERFGGCWLLPNTAPSASGDTLLQRADVTASASGCLNQCMNPYEALKGSATVPGVFLDNTSCRPDAGPDGAPPTGP